MNIYGKRLAVAKYSTSYTVHQDILIHLYTWLSINEAILVTLLKKHTFETRGAKAPCLNFRIRERMFQGAKVPGSESSAYGTFAPRAKVRGNKSSSYHIQ